MKSHKIILFALLLLGTVACSSHKKGYRFYKNSGTPVRVDSTLVADQELDKWILPYRDSLKLNMDKVIGYASEPLIKEKPQGSLGNFVADLLLEYAKTTVDPEVQMCLLNYGGLRIAEIPEGPVTMGRIYELMPFDNQVVVLTLTPEAFDSVLLYIAEMQPPFAGIQVQVFRGKPKYVKMNNEQYVSGKTVKIVTTDYLAKGGDSMTFLKKASETGKETGILLRDVIKEKIISLNNKGQKIVAVNDTRIVMEMN
jgi:2',3'-cyclic-nucleotide 2'-phosphodiesterase (5'-nucleotidase family)